MSKLDSIRKVRRPPPLQSITRLQQTVGNRAVQRLLHIGHVEQVKSSPVIVNVVSPKHSRSRRSVWIARVLAVILMLFGALAVILMLLRT
jgi:hypothetical protein